MKVLLLSRYGPLGASSRVRTYQYLPHLRQKGLDIDVSPLFDDPYLLKLYSGGRPLPASMVLKRLMRVMRLRNFDLVWLEKEAFPWLPFFFEQLLRLSGKPWVVDYDDAIFHRYDRHRNAVVRRFLGRKIAAVMQAAATVVTGNEYLARYARDAGAERVRIVPSVVDMQRYSPAQPEPPAVFRIGWIGTPVTARYLHAVAAPLAEVRAGGSCVMRLVGSGPVEMKGLPVEIVPWDLAAEADQAAGFNVGIMPLPDSPWERGKCGYKLLQYMAAGRPVVASAVGANCEIVEHGTTGFLVSTEAEWVEALKTLRDDAGLRRRMGEAGRERVEERYSLAVTAPVVAEILEEAASRAGR